MLPANSPDFLRVALTTRVDLLEKTHCWEGLGAEGEVDDRG